MKDLIKYYSLTLIFYAIEITIFKITHTSWVYDIFWLNLLLRTVLVFFFSIIVRNTIFKDSKFFYAKIFGLILISPVLASFVIKLLTLIYPLVSLVILKLIGDLISSILVFIILKRIS
jgi:hypothetical protein